MLVADLRRDFVNTWFTPLADASFAEMEEIFAEHGAARPRQRRRAAGMLVERRRRARAPTCAMSARSTPSPSSCRSSCSRAQDRDGIKRRFDAVHETRYGFSVAGEKAEIVSLRSAVIGLMRKPPFEQIAAGGAEPDAAAFRGKRAGLFRRAPASSTTPTYDRARLLKAGNRIAGPALIEEHASTTVRASRRRARRSMRSAISSSTIRRG